MFPLFLIALLGGMLQVWATAQGIGVSPDSVSYIGATRSFRAGQGMLSPFLSLMTLEPEPLADFPPLYPLVLAVGEPVETARWLGAALMIGLPLLCGALVWMLSAGWWPGVWTAAALVAFSPSLLAVHSNAWSEPLFLFTGFAGIGFAARYAAARRWPDLLAYAACTALAFLTRYAGLAFVAFGLLVLAGARVSWKEKLRDLLIFGAVSVLPAGLWMGSRYFQMGQVGNRSLALHLPTLAHLVPALDSRAFLFGMALVLSLVFTRLGKPAQEEPHPFLKWLDWFPAVYLLTILASITVGDVFLRLEDRILTPWYAAVVVICCARFRPESLVALRRWAVVGLVALVGCASAALSVSWAARSSQEGIGYQFLDWKQSDLIAYVRSLPQDVLVYSNGADAVAFFTGRPAAFLPEIFSQTSGQTNVQYTAEVAAVRSHGGLVIYFNNLPWRYEYPSEEELCKQLGLRLIYSGRDGNVFQITR